MVEADLAGLAAARGAYAANRSNEKALNEMRWSHVHEYRIMLTTIGNDEAEAVLKRYLLDVDFGPEAAVGLQVIWQQRNEPVPNDNVRKFSQWPDFAVTAGKSVKGPRPELRHSGSRFSRPQTPCVKAGR